MKLNRTSFLILFLPMLFNACGQAKSVPGPTSTPTSFSGQTLPTVGTYSTGNNILPVTVNGNLCGSKQYQNEICTQITLCSPSDPTNCQTISNLLVDTGSYGLRVFSSVITVPLTPIVSGSMNLAECVQFGDGSSEWGPVEYAYVKLGGEPAVGIPILVINSTYGTAPPACSDSQSFPDTSPSAVGFNGILGVGLFSHDCGSDCVTDTKNGQYFTCAGTSQGSDCSSGATVALNAQVQNPVSQIPNDNNGVILELPDVTSTSGTTSVSGSLVIGIGTQSNNTPASTPTVYLANAYGNFKTTFSAYSATAMTSSFIDSGSSVLFFPAPTDGSLPDCSDNSGLFCPSTIQNLTAINASASGGTSGSVSFQIGNALTLVNSSNMVFKNLGADLGGFSTPFFDWGLPFFFGKNVYVGISGTSSTLGTGPYWAY